MFDPAKKKWKLRTISYHSLYNNFLFISHWTFRVGGILKNINHEYVRWIWLNMWLKYLVWVDMLIYLMKEIISKFLSDFLLISKLFQEENSILKHMVIFTLYCISIINGIYFCVALAIILWLHTDVAFSLAVSGILEKKWLHTSNSI